MENNRFATRCFERDNRAATHLAAGSGCGRYGNERGKAGPIGLLVKFGKIKLWSFDQQASRFAYIQCASATEADNAITIVLAIHGGCLADIVFNGVGMDA